MVRDRNLKFDTWNVHEKEEDTRIFSSPELKAHKVSLLVYQWSVVRPSSSTLSNLNISEASWPILSNFMWNITGVGERLHKVLGQIGSKLWFPWQQKAPIDL